MARVLRASPSGTATRLDRARTGTGTGGARGVPRPRGLPANFRNGACHTRADILHNGRWPISLAQPWVAERSRAARGSWLAALAGAGSLDDGLDSGSAGAGCRVPARGVRHRAASGRRRRRHGYGYVVRRLRKAQVSHRSRPAPRDDSAAGILWNPALAGWRGMLGGFGCAL